MADVPVFIPGVHYFCDHRCWRCGLSDRCAVFARLAALPKRRRSLGDGPVGRVAAVLAVSLDVTMEDAGVLMSGGVMPGPSASAGASVEAAQAARERPVEDGRRDPLVVRGSEYAHGSWSVLRALRPILARRADAEASDAAERLEETCVTVASKVFRAVSSTLDPDFDPAETRSDANGSAKVALILIEESRQAWRVLMQPGRAAANGVPARLVRVLDALEAELLRRFPRAFEFVRPGFDTGDASGASGQMANALLAAGRPAGTA